MIGRTIYIGNSSNLKVKDNQLIILDSVSNELKGTVPIEDIAILVLDHYQITLTNQLILKLQSNKVVIVNCDAQHLPFGIMLPIYGHSEHSQRVKYQLEATEPLKKQLWKQTVIQKIQNQQTLLQITNKDYNMDTYWQNVKTGDVTNCEGQAANYYWKHLLDDFYRGRFGSEPNNLLNFGYSILRSMVARALVSSGLLPVLGIHHKNKYNPYCLADDIMEPYRPYIDKLVCSYITLHGYEQELTKEVKAYLLTIATQDVYIDGVVRPLMVAVTTTTASLYKCYTGEMRQIMYPVLR